MFLKNLRSQDPCLFLEYSHKNSEFSSHDSISLSKKNGPKLRIKWKGESNEGEGGIKNIVKDS